MNEQALPQSMEAFVITHGYRPHRNSVSLIDKAREVDTALRQARMARDTAQEWVDQYIGEINELRPALAQARERCAALEAVVRAAIGTHGETCIHPETCPFLRDANALLQASGEKI